MRFSADRPLNVQPATVRDYRELARRRLPRQLFDYLDGGAYEEETLKANESDLAKVLLRQRVMKDVSVREQATEILGQKASMPAILGPVGLAGMFARRAEVQAARAAEKAGIPFTESTVSICSIEEVRAATTAPFWYQLYVMRDRTYAESLMARANAVGCDTLLLTVDLPVVGERYRDTRNGMVGTIPTTASIRRGLDLATHPLWIRDVAIGGKPLTFGNLEAAVPGARTPQEFKSWVDAQFDNSVTWDDLAWVRESWNGRVVIKGVLDAEDARIALDHGVDGLVVSNHGGRQLDDVPSTAAALGRIVEAVGTRTDIMVDGGVRSGLDVLKMLALGADGVLIGRAWAWAVAARGRTGVEHVLRILRSELEVAMSLTGITSIAAADPAILVALGEG